MRRLVATIALVAGCSTLFAGDAAPPSAYDHLRAIEGLSPAPEYRRAGTAGMAAVADYVAGRFTASGYRVVRFDFPFTRWAIDYSAGNAPSLVRADDGTTFKAESGFDLDTGTVTHVPTVTCRVVKPADVRPGTCGFVSFGKASPEWKNSPFVDVGAELDTIVARHGAGAIVQGDLARDLVFALRVRRPIPTVVAVAHDAELIGRRVTIRAVGRYVSATGHDVVAIRKPPAGTKGYAMLLAHGDGWFQAAADNGSGAAAVIRAAEILARARPKIGVIAVVTDAEELGLIGADRLAEALDAGLAVGDGGPAITTADIKAIVNLDACSARASDVQDTIRGIARRDAPLFSWRAMVSSEDPLLTGAFLARFAAHQVLGAPIPAAIFKPVASASLSGRQRTDVGPFEERGIPFVWPVVGYPEYHTDGDTLAAVDPADLENVALAAADLMRDLATLALGRIPAPLR
jgi:hypothetical protein